VDIGLDYTKARGLADRFLLRWGGITGRPRHQGASHSTRWL
jgi:hypothetical protein